MPFPLHDNCMVKNKSAVSEFRTFFLLLGHFGRNDVDFKRKNRYGREEKTRRTKALTTVRHEI